MKGAIDRPMTQHTAHPVWWWPRHHTDTAPTPHDLPHDLAHDLAPPPANPMHQPTNQPINRHRHLSQVSVPCKSQPDPDPLCRHRDPRPRQESEVVSRLQFTCGQASVGKLEAAQRLEPPGKPEAARKPEVTKTTDAARHRSSGPAWQHQDQPCSGSTTSGRRMMKLEHRPTTASFFAALTASASAFAAAFVVFAALLATPSTSGAATSCPRLALDLLEAEESYAVILEGISARGINRQTPAHELLELKYALLRRNVSMQEKAETLGCDLDFSNLFGLTEPVVAALDDAIRDQARERR